MTAITPRPGPLLAGLEHDFGGAAGRLVVPPLSLGALELLQERIAKLPEQHATDPAAIATFIDCLHAALGRNYEISREQVAELLDVSTMFDVFDKVMDIGGVRRRAQTMAAAEGNAGEGAPAAGGPSTP